jgi:hypothetical protein
MRECRTAPMKLRNKVMPPDAAESKTDFLDNETTDY